MSIRSKQGQMTMLYQSLLSHGSMDNCSFVCSANGAENPLWFVACSVRRSKNQSHSSLSRTEITSFACCDNPKIKSNKFEFGAKYRGTQKRQLRSSYSQAKASWKSMDKSIGTSQIVGQLLIVCYFVPRRVQRKCASCIHLTFTRWKTLPIQRPCSSRAPTTKSSPRRQCKAAHPPKKRINRAQRVAAAAVAAAAALVIRASWMQHAAAVVAAYVHRYPHLAPIWVVAPQTAGTWLHWRPEIQLVRIQSALVWLAVKQNNCQRSRIIL